MSNFPTGEGKKDNGTDLPYHLHRLLNSEEAGVDERTQAARAIFYYTKHSIEEVLEDDLLARFIEAYEQVDNVILRSEIASILSYRWSTREEVQQLMRTALHTEDAALEELYSFYFWLESRIEDSPELVEQSSIQELVSDAHKLFDRGEDKKAESLERCALNLLRRWGIAVHAHEQGMKKVDTDFSMETLIACRDADSDTLHRVSGYVRTLLDEEQTEEWKRGLINIYLDNRKSDLKFAMNAIETLALLEGKSQREMLVELRDMAEEDEDDEEGYVESRNPLDLLFGSIPSTFTPEEERILAENIREQSQTPVSLLTELVQEKPYVFLRALADETVRKLPSIIHSLEKDANLTHIAINIPPENAEHFRQFLSGEDPPELKYALEGDSQFADVGYKKTADLYREVLRQIDAMDGVEWAFIGTPQNISPQGEIALDQHVSYLARICKEHPQAKVLVFDQAYLGFVEETSKNDLTHAEDDSKRQSLAKRLADTVGQERIACIRAEDTQGSFEDPTGVDNEIGEFCQKHGIITSFGLRVKDTPLAAKGFDEQFQETYSEAWDGILVFFLGDDDDDKDHEDAPDPSFGKELSPNGVLV